MILCIIFKIYQAGYDFDDEVLEDEEVARKLEKKAS
jgi:hypothetical protein